MIGGEHDVCVGLNHDLNFLVKGRVVELCLVFGSCCLYI